MEIKLKRIIDVEGKTGFTRQLQLETEKDQAGPVISMNIKGDSGEISSWQSQHHLISIDDTVDIKFIQKQNKL